MGEAAAAGVRQCEAMTLTTAVDADRLAPAPGFLHVEDEDVKELIGKCQEE